MNSLKTLAAALVAAVLLVAPGARADIVPENGVLDFTVVRDGTDIGTHRLTFRQNGNRIEMDIATRIAVKIAFVTVYRFEHDGHEVWENGKLVEMRTKTHDDGTDHMLQVVRGADGNYQVTADGKSFSADGSLVPASLWNPEFIRTGKLMNSILGTPLKIAVAYKGEEQVDVHGRKVKAKHYSMTGDFARELWYDDHWVLVHMELKGKDGSPVTYVLR